MVLDCYGIVMTLELVNRNDCIDSEHPLRWVRKVDRDRKSRHKTTKDKIDEWTKRRQQNR